MSVLHTLISTKAMALAELYQDTPDWPAGTTFTDSDITVGQQSLTSLAAERGTPCVLIAPSGARQPGEEYRTVVVATVLSCTPRAGWRHPMEVTIDCDLRALDGRVLDTLLLQHPNARHRNTVLVHAPGQQTTIRAWLPETAAPGDLLTLTVAGTIALGQVMSHPTRPATGENDDEQWQGRCLKK